MCSSTTESAPKLDTSAMRPGNRSSIASRSSERALTLAKRSSRRLAAIASPNNLTS